MSAKERERQHPNERSELVIYRSIGLTCCIGKCFEGMVNRWFLKFLEGNHVTDAYQFRLRAMHSASHPLVVLKYCKHYDGPRHQISSISTVACNHHPCAFKWFHLLHLYNIIIAYAGLGWWLRVRWINDFCLHAAWATNVSDWRPLTISSLVQWQHPVSLLPYWSKVYIPPESNV